MVDLEVLASLRHAEAIAMTFLNVIRCECVGRHMQCKDDGGGDVGEGDADDDDVGCGGMAMMLTTSD